jgi:outer membrane receptor protein involved in Fe transport
MNESSSILKITTVALKFLFLLFVVAADLSAETVGKISGKITDAETGEPIIGCNVLLVGTTMGAVTDIEGSYFILNVQAGKYDIQASIVGYQKEIQTGAIVNGGRTTTLDFKLKSTAIAQDAVIVEAKRPDVEPEKTSTSTIIRPEDVQQIAGMRDISDVISLGADVTDGHFRGGRSGEELYTLQGMGITNPLDASAAFVPIMSAVEEVEVITSGFDAQYGNAQSGVVNISMKEGKSDKWSTRFEVRMRAPGRKHFGPSVYDASNSYLSKLLDPNTWRNGDADNNNLPYFSSFSNTKDGYARDTLVEIQVAMALWKLQMKRDLNKEYGNSIDYSIEGSTGGPIDEDNTMFLALRSNVSNPIFPTEKPDVQQQVMGNVVSNLGNEMTFRLSGGYARNNQNVFPSSNGLGYYNWLWDRILSTQYQKNTNLQLGARFTEALSAATFYEIKLNALQTHLNLGSSPWSSSIPDSLFGVSRNTNTILTKPVTDPAQFSYFKGNDDFRDEKTLTVSLDASMTSQVSKNHLLNGGIQFNQYTISSNNYGNTSGTLQTRIFTAHPYEGGLYAQDKMEFEGMIAKIGVRLDVWNADKAYYINQFNPFAVLDSAGKISNVANPALAPQGKPPILARLQPRTGISFPITVNTVFHLNYGSFMQRPSFQYIVASTMQPGANSFASPITLGNPRLKPQTTNAYDVGVNQGLGEGFTLDISGYYKDVQNLIEQAIFSDNVSGISYSTYFNRDYADIRGFRIALSKKRGNFTGSLNYQYGIATGKSATVSNAAPVFIQDSLLNVVTSTENVPNRDIVLDFDRTHNFIVTLAYRTDEELGPETFGWYPFGNIIVSSNSFARSGRPYTSSKNTKLINGARTPAEYNTNIKITKLVNNFFGMKATFYVEIFNLFNDKILNYSYLFPKINAGQSNQLIEAYDNVAIDDPANGVLYWNATNTQKALSFPVNQSFLVYDNAPRSYYAGFSVEF